MDIDLASIAQRFTSCGVIEGREYAPSCMSEWLADDIAALIAYVKVQHTELDGARSATDQADEWAIRNSNAAVGWFNALKDVLKHEDDLIQELAGANLSLAKQTGRVDRAEGRAGYFSQLCDAKDDEIAELKEVILAGVLRAHRNRCA